MTRIRRVITAINPAGQAFSEVHSETQVGERWLANDPKPLADAGTEAAAWKTEYAAALEAERNSLLTSVSALNARVATLTTERDAALAKIVPLEAQVADLQAKLNPPVNPRHVAPFDFIALFTAAELYAVMTSSDPTVIVGRTKLQTIITFVDLDHPDTINLVGYLELIGLIAVGRAAQILAGEAPLV